MKGAGVELLFSEGRFVCLFVCFSPLAVYSSGFGGRRYERDG